MQVTDKRRRNLCRNKDENNFKVTRERLYRNSSRLGFMHETESPKFDSQVVGKISQMVVVPNLAC